MRCLQVYWQMFPKIPVEHTAYAYTWQSQSEVCTPSTNQPISFAATQGTRWFSGETTTLLSQASHHFYINIYLLKYLTTFNYTLAGSFLTYACASKIVNVSDSNKLWNHFFVTAVFSVIWFIASVPELLFKPPINVLYLSCCSRPNNCYLPAWLLRFLQLFRFKSFLFWAFSPFTRGL